MAQMGCKKVYVDHYYAPETTRKRWEYTGVKKVLRENKLQFRILFQARMRVFNEGETCLYNSAQEATQRHAEERVAYTNHKKTDNNLKWQRTQSLIGGEQQPEVHWDGFKKKLDAFRQADS